MHSSRAGAPMPSRALAPDPEPPSPPAPRPELAAVPERAPGQAVDPQDSTARICYVGHLVTIWGIALSNLFFGLSFLLTLRGWRRVRLGSRAPTLLLPLGAYAGLFVASATLSVDPARSWANIGDLHALVTLPLGLLLLRGTEAVRRTIDLIVLSIAASALWGLGQFALGTHGALDHRLPGPFSHYQTFAGVLLIGTLLALARASASTGRARLLFWAAVGLLSFTLILTLTRGPWVALAVTGLALALRSGRRGVPALAITVLALAAFSTLAPESWTERARSIVDPTDESNYDRLCMLEAGFDMLAERPFLGQGPETVRDLYPAYRDVTAPRFDVPHLHNSHLHIAAEQGLVSWFAYLWLMGAAVVLAIRSYREEGGSHGPRSDLWLAVVLVVVGFNVAGLFEANWRDTEVQRLVLFVLAVPACLGPVGPRRTDEP